MITLNPLPMTGDEIRLKISPGIRKKSRRDRFDNDEAAIVKDERAFRNSMASGNVRSLAASPFTPTVQGDMEWLYDQRLVKSAPGRPIWEKILKLGGEKCPLCHISKARTLDHSIPKSVHPRLSVEPQNLVPSCRDCNMERGVGHRNMSLSPYVDSWAVDLPWLMASIPDLAYPGDLIFAPKRHEEFSNTQWDSLTEFFKDTDLGSRYSNLAIDEFLPLFTELRNHYPGIRPLDEVQSILNERWLAIRGALGDNRWQTAAYSAWLQCAHSIAW